MTDQQWYIRKDGVIHGPASTQQLKSLLVANRINLHVEAGETKDGPWRALGDYPDFAPVRPIDDLFETPSAPAVPQGQAQPLAPSAVRSIVRTIAPPDVPPVTTSPAPVAGTLTEKARIEFLSGLEVEVNRQIEDKCFPVSIAAWIITLIAIARFNMILAFVFAFIVGGIVYKIAKAILQGKYQRPIYDLSDEMLVSRYNEFKADRRAARTRTAISWAVIVVVAVVIAIAWLAARKP